MSFWVLFNIEYMENLKNNHFLVFGIFLMYMYLKYRFYNMEIIMSMLFFPAYNKCKSYLKISLKFIFIGI